VTTLVAESPELKKLYIRVLKRVHPDLAVDELDRHRCERLTQQANEAYARKDEVALRAVLKLNTLPPADLDDHGDSMPGADPGARGTHAPTPNRLPSRREELAILCAAGVVLSLLLYGILGALREEVGTGSAVFCLALLAAGVLWWIMRRSGLIHKTRWAVGAGGGMLLAGICLFSFGIGPHSAFSPDAASPQPFTSTLAWKNAEHQPSPMYASVIQDRIGQSWNPAGVAGVPAGATAELGFTIARDGSPHNVQLRKTSGSPSLDTSCVLAVEQVKTFGPPDGGAEAVVREGLSVDYPCSYDDLAMRVRQAQLGAVPLPESVKPVPAIFERRGTQVGDYLDLAKSRVAQNWDTSEVVGVPKGATVYIQFIIWPHGNHDVPMTETSSGYPSLDGSCLHAVQKIKTFGHLPRSYQGSNMTVFYQCTYPGPGGGPGRGPAAATNSTAESGHHAVSAAHDSPVSN
jgi:TonB family protein